MFVSGNYWIEQIEPKLQIQTYLDRPNIHIHS